MLTSKSFTSKSISRVTANSPPVYSRSASTAKSPPVCGTRAGVAPAAPVGAKPPPYSAASDKTGSALPISTSTTRIWPLSAFGGSTFASCLLIFFWMYPVNASRVRQKLRSLPRAMFAQTAAAGGDAPPPPPPPPSVSPWHSAPKASRQAAPFSPRECRCGCCRAAAPAASPAAQPCSHTQNHRSSSRPVAKRRRTSAAPSKTSPPSRARRSSALLSCHRGHTRPFRVAFSTRTTHRSRSTVPRRSSPSGRSTKRIGSAARRATRVGAAPGRSSSTSLEEVHSGFVAAVAAAEEEEGCFGASCARRAA
eukprot:Rhum_TRINITY_DN14639_c5_g1::Rhum_TRINITY_DN14639_c5_g1_i1::g.106717::m.106717